MTAEVIRPATPADAGAILALVERSYRGDEAKKGWTHEADLLIGKRTDLDTIRANIAGPDRMMLAAEVNGQLVGCVLVIDEGDAAYLGMLSVEPRLQGTGLGRRLVAAAEAEARSRFGARRMRMTVIVQRAELIAWYVRLGYVETGEMTPFPKDEEHDSIALRPDLAFTVMAKAI